MLIKLERPSAAGTATDNVTWGPGLPAPSHVQVNVVQVGNQLFLQATGPTGVVCTICLFPTGQLTPIEKQSLYARERLKPRPPAPFVRQERVLPPPKPRLPRRIRPLILRAPVPRAFVRTVRPVTGRRVQVRHVTHPRPAVLAAAVSQIRAPLRVHKVPAPRPLPARPRPVVAVARVTAPIRTVRPVLGRRVQVVRAVHLRPAVRVVPVLQVRSVRVHKAAVPRPRPSTPRRAARPAAILQVRSVRPVLGRRVQLAHVRHATRAPAAAAAVQRHIVVRPVTGRRVRVPAPPYYPRFGPLM